MYMGIRIFYVPNPNAGWSPVVAWWHRSSDETVKVVEIVTSSGKLLATPEPCARDGKEGLNG